MQDDIDFGQHMRFNIGSWAKSQAEDRVRNRVLITLFPYLHGYDQNLVHLAVLSRAEALRYNITAIWFPQG
jgi:hypothetical protein